METEVNGKDADADGENHAGAEELLRRLGITNIEEGLLDGEPPEPVVRERLVAYVRQELTPCEKGIVNHLVSNYREWYEAFWSIANELDTTGPHGNTVTDDDDDDI